MKIKPLTANKVKKIIYQGGWENSNMKPTLQFFEWIGEEKTLKMKYVTKYVKNM